MKKKIVSSLIPGILALALGFVSTPARSELSLGLVGGYYSPHFGEVNDELDELNDAYDTDFGFKSGLMYGLALGYDVNPNFRLRIEYNSFGSKTSDDYWTPWFYYNSTVYHDIDLSLIVTPLILSGIYKFSPFYMGVGLGSFSITMKATWENEFYRDGILDHIWADSHSENYSPVGTLALGGFEYTSEGFSAQFEARYVIAEVELEEGPLYTSVDLGGFQVCVGIRIPLQTRESG